MSTSQEKKLPSNRTYTVDDIAAILGIAKSTAYRLVNSGEFKTIRIGYAIRISRKSFEDWLAMEEPEEKNLITSSGAIDFATMALTTFYGNYKIGFTQKLFGTNLPDRDRHLTIQEFFLL